MARITMRNSQKATFAEVFEIYISAVTARGVKDKTIATYKQHFHAISKRLDVSMPINLLNSTALDNMILQMRKEGLSDSSINSYTRTLKCFLSWCNEEGYTNVWNIGDRNNEITGSRKQCSGSTWTAFACWGTSPPPKDQPCMLAICPKLCSNNGGGSIGFPRRGKCPKAWQGHRSGRFCNLKGKVRTSEWYILPLFSLVFCI